MSVSIINSDCLSALRELPDESVHCVVTSPPYWGLRLYGGEPGMIGLEATLDEHIANLVDVFREVRRVLRSDGTLWLNYGDAYSHGRDCGRSDAEISHGRDHWSLEHRAKGARHKSGGLEAKQLLMMPARIAIALQTDGWWLRSEIVWAKKSCMPESVTDRPTSSHEKVFLMAKSKSYFYDADAVRTPSNGWNGKDKPTHAPEHSETQSNGARNEQASANLRNVWHVGPEPFSEAHFATFPQKLVEPCIMAGCPEGGVVLDPFGGSGTVGLVADKLGRDAILIEINADYCEMARHRIEDSAPMFAKVEVR